MENIKHHLIQFNQLIIMKITKEHITKELLLKTTIYNKIVSITHLIYLLTSTKTTKLFKSHCASLELSDIETMPLNIHRPPLFIMKPPPLSPLQGPLPFRKPEQ